MVRVGVGARGCGTSQHSASLTDEAGTVPVIRDAIASLLELAIASLTQEGQVVRDWDQYKY